MTHILDFAVNRQHITWLNPCRVPVENTVGFLKAKFTVDEEWDGLSLVATFQSGIDKPVMVPISGELTDVPPEAIRRGQLYVGMIGLGDGGRVRLVTKEMTQPVRLSKSAPVDGEPPQDITLEAWEQALGSIGDVSKLDTFDKSSLVNAINEIRRTGGGGGGEMSFDIDDVTLTVQDGTLKVNTINAVEQDNKQPITSGAVYTEFGKIVALLETI